MTILFQLDKLIGSFQNLLTVQREIIVKKEVLSTKLQSLKDTYTQLVKTNSKKIFLFCLDSFYFQYKILTIEMDNINRFSSMINNRMYGDYYKLYQLILVQLPDSHRNAAPSTDRTYPPYRELEPFFEYKVADIIHLHRDILRILHFLQRKFNEKQTHIQTYSDEINVGRSISSFLQTHEYENTLLREQIMLYVNYLDFFHVTQTNYIHKLFLHLDRFQREIEEEIMTNYASIRPPDVSELNFRIPDEEQTLSIVDSEPPLTEIEQSFCLETPADPITTPEAPVIEMTTMAQTTEMTTMAQTTETTTSPPADPMTTTSSIEVQTPSDVSDPNNEQDVVTRRL
jgi:hypothetical protein